MIRPAGVMSTLRAATFLTGRKSVFSNGERQKIDQCGSCNPRRANLHSGAGNRVQHPCRNDRNHAGCRLYVDNVTSGTLLAIMATDATSIQRMPLVVNNNFLPDMGRMTPRSLLAGRITSSAVRIQAVSELRRSTLS
jgi:hypothetical protein